MGADELLRAVIDAPDDDAPRLVFADYLAEHGATEAERARAEFIQVQCALARPAELEGDPARARTLAAREAHLLTRWAAAWTLDCLAGASAVEYRRGFVERVTMRGPWFLERAAEITSRTPLSDLRLTHMEPAVARALAAGGYLARLDALTLSGPVGAAGLTALDETPTPLRVTQLDLGQARMDPAAVAALGALTRVPRLRRFSVRYARTLGPSTARAIALCPSLQGLHELDLGWCELGDGGVAAVLRTGRFPALKVLHLGGNAVSNKGAVTVAAASIVGRIEALDLRSNRIGVQGARALAASPHVRALAALDLRANRVGVGGAQALAASEALAGIARLDVSENALGAEEIALLRARFGARVVV